MSIRIGPFTGLVLLAACVACPPSRAGLFDWLRPCEGHVRTSTWSATLALAMAPPRRLTTLVVPVSRSPYNAGADRRLARSVAETCQPHFGTLVLPWLLETARQRELAPVLEDMQATHLQNGVVDPAPLRGVRGWLLPDLVLTVQVLKYDQPWVDSRKLTRIGLEGSVYDARSGDREVHEAVEVLHKRCGTGSVFDEAEARAVADLVAAMEPQVRDAVARIAARYLSPTDTPAATPTLTPTPMPAALGPTPAGAADGAAPAAGAPLPETRFVDGVRGTGAFTRSLQGDSAPSGNAPTAESIQGEGPEAAGDAVRSGTP